MWEESSEITCPGNAATQRLKEFHCSWAPSSFTSIESLDDSSVSKYNVEDLCIRRVLGQGSFSTAHLVNLKQGHAGHSNSVDTCVMKRLKPVIVMNRRASNVAASDLALEAQILANLQHTNIISLRGICSGDLHESLNKGEFFILVDLLVDTLDARLLRWTKRKFCLLPPSKPSLKDRLNDIAVGIADGMSYLHAKQLIFRDLKPANIGFDKSGTVKLFDFGFAREHKGSGELRKQQRRMTGGTGTPRYMAPEVARMEEDYGFSADVYSFAILLWQIVTTRVPFSEFKTPTEFYAKVVLGEQRPSLKYLKSDDLATLISQCWSPDPKKRLTFPNIRCQLENIIKSTPDPRKRLTFPNIRSRLESIIKSKS